MNYWDIYKALWVLTEMPREIAYWMEKFQQIVWRTDAFVYHDINSQGGRKQGGRLNIQITIQ